MIQANDPTLQSWVEVPENSDFPIQNIPFGIFKTTGHSPRACTAIGEKVLDLQFLHENGYFHHLDLPPGIFAHDTLNAFIALGKPITNNVRNRIAELLSTECAELRERDYHCEEAFFNFKEVEMLMPVFVRDYTDFYSSKEHATNVGSMFRDPDNALLPNWKHMPVAYHGRASSIIVSGTPIKRPKGQAKNPDEDMPHFGPTKRLDFELEMAFVVGKSTQLGDTVPLEQAEDHIFGMVLFNDWSARDIQPWEYVPLGPFLGKNFGSSISPWIVTLEALAPFRVEGPKQDVPVLPYLQFEGQRNFDINLEVGIAPEAGQEKIVCQSNHKYLYWNIAQQLAHHTVNGCNIAVGDMYASGTISGPEPSSFGSMLEIAWKGTRPVAMPDGTERKFIHDGDTVIMRAHAQNDQVRIGFGEVRSKVLPANED